MRESGHLRIFRQQLAMWASVRERDIFAGVPALGGRCPFPLLEGIPAMNLQDRQQAVNTRKGKGQKAVNA
jgi:hypothetical protein